MLDLVFVGCLLAFWRLFAKSARALLATAVVALIGYSYYGWFVIARHFARLLPASLAAMLDSQFAFEAFLTCSSGCSWSNRRQSSRLRCFSLFSPSYYPQIDGWGSL